MLFIIYNTIQFGGIKYNSIIKIIPRFYGMYNINYLFSIRSSSNLVVIHSQILYLTFIIVFIIFITIFRRIIIIFVNQIS